jgi:hypothetical protein
LEHFGVFFLYVFDIDSWMSCGFISYRIHFGIEPELVPEEDQNASRMGTFPKERDSDISTPCGGFLEGSFC